MVRERPVLDQLGGACLMSIRGPPGASIGTPAWDSVGAAATVSRGLLVTAQKWLAACQNAAARMAHTVDCRQLRGRRLFAPASMTARWLSGLQHEQLKSN